MFSLDHPTTSRPQLRIDRQALEVLRRELGGRPPETGAMLGGGSDGVVRVAHLDVAGSATSTSYTPDDSTLSNLLANVWNPAGMSLVGFAHSHPGTFDRPSPGDRVYSERILRANPHMREFLLPIALTEHEGRRFTLTGWAATRSGSSVRLEERDVVAVATTSFADPAFVRAETTYDRDLLVRRTVFIVGVGGARGFAEDLARTGICRIVLIDPDVVELSNVATQGAYRRDLGRPKVDVVAEGLRDINPFADVVAIHAPIDALADEELVELAGPVDGVLIAGCTDNFFAQARCARIGLQFGWASVAGQVYAEGRGVEVTFAYPGLTPACQRCVLSSRYDAYADGYTNTVTSAGAPIVATTRLNALKGQIALALLHLDPTAPQVFDLDRDNGGRRWRELARGMARRNLVQVRLDPRIDHTLGLSVFRSVLRNADRKRLYVDDAVWLPQRPNNPTNGMPFCPDCGGTGDLRDTIGRFDDTRVGLGIAPR